MSNESGDPAASPAAQPHILIVDDFSDNREMYAEYLVFSGFRVSEAVDGHEALRKASEVLPDLIVMDLSLPRLDGWEATRRLKADRRTRLIPVVALTGHALEGNAQAAFDSGCDAFLTKPCEPDTLLRAIWKILREWSNPPLTKTHRKSKKPGK
jgi:CheY-like chemotaxis protein